MRAVLGPKVAGQGANATELGAAGLLCRQPPPTSGSRPSPPPMRAALCVPPHPLLAGGVAACPGFRERLEAELRPLVPDDYALGLHLPEDPASAAWRGAALVGASADYQRLAVSRQQYLQHGAAACLARWSS